MNTKILAAFALTALFTACGGAEETAAQDDALSFKTTASTRYAPKVTRNTEITASEYICSDESGEWLCFHLVTVTGTHFKPNFETNYVALSDGSAVWAISDEAGNFTVQLWANYADACQSITSQAIEYDPNTFAWTYGPVSPEFDLAPAAAADCGLR